VLAQVALAGGDLDGAADEISLSQSMLENADNRYELAQTLLVSVKIAANQGKAIEIRNMIDTATAIFTDLGALRDLEQAQELAEAV
jgi:flagellin-specific chaperone FliS